MSSTERNLWRRIQLADIEEQPNFPGGADLNEVNTTVLQNCIRQGVPEIDAGAHHWSQEFHGLYYAMQSILAIRGIEPRRHPSEYSAFCRGFAAFGFIRQAVSSTVDSPNESVRRARQLFIDPGMLVDIENADRYGQWLDDFPNVLRVLTHDPKPTPDLSPATPHLRAIGAMAAYDLRMGLV